MNLLRHSLILAACLSLSALQAQTAPATDSKSKDAGAPTLKSITTKSEFKKKTVDGTPKEENKDDDDDDKKKPSKEELEKVHELAAVTVSMGGEKYQIIFELLPEGAPQTVENFRSNAEKGVYTGMAFHRTIENYLVQTGDPASKDNANREQWGLTQEYTIPGEFKLPHVPGAVAMARRGDKVNPDRKSDGTQFYFVLGNMAGLSGQYTVFGQVVSGQDILKKISRAAHDSNDCPLERIEIKDVKVIQQKGPIANLVTTGQGKQRRSTRPDALKGPMEKFLDRVW